MAETPDNKPKVNVLLGAKLTLFNRKLAVVYEKKGDNSHTFLLIPTKMDTDTEGITFDEMTNEIKNVFSKNDDDITQLTTTIPNDETTRNKARFHLTMAYLYFEYSEDMNNQKKVEFAFQVTVTDIANLVPVPNNNLFSIDEFQLAIWSTKNQKIIDAMHLIKPSDFIPKQE